MDLCILVDKKVVPTTDSITWYAWKREHKDELVVARSTIGDIRIKTYFRGEDPMGAGYVFQTETSNGDAYGAKSWEQAEQNHQWTCEHFERLQEHQEFIRTKQNRQSTTRE